LAGLRKHGVEILTARANSAAQTGSVEYSTEVSVDDRTPSDVVWSITVMAVVTHPVHTTAPMTCTRKARFYISGANVHKVDQTYFPGC